MDWSGTGTCRRGSCWVSRCGRPDWWEPLPSVPTATSWGRPARELPGCSTPPPGTSGATAWTSWAARPCRERVSEDRAAAQVGVIGATSLRRRMPLPQGFLEEAQGLLIERQGLAVVALVLAL